MESRDVMDQVRNRRTADHRFIKWWRREHDFLNFDLIDRFEERLPQETGIKWLEGFDLLNTEQMWSELQKRVPERVRREKRRSGEVIVWDRGEEGEQVCPFTAENVMVVFNVETRGNVIDG